MITALIENISLCQKRQDWRMCVPPRPDDTDIVLRDCEQTILELCALLEKAEKALENAIAKNEMYIGVTQQEEAIAAIKQWREMQ